MKILSFVLSIATITACDKAARNSQNHPPTQRETPGPVSQPNGSTPESGQQAAGQLNELRPQNFSLAIGLTNWSGTVDAQKQIALKALPTEYAIEVFGNDETHTLELNQNYRTECTGMNADSSSSSQIVGDVQIRLQNYPRDTEVLEGIRYQVRKSLDQSDLSIARPTTPRDRNLNFDSSARSSGPGKLNDAFVRWSQNGATLAVLAYHGRATTSLPMGTLCDIVDRKISMNLNW